jgi:cystathionine beta-lyase/cystathionine gamma-synthase
MKNEYEKATLSVHAGKKPDSLGVVSSIETSSAFHYIDEDTQLYPRYFNTPNQQIVVDQICRLEGAEAGLIFGSGMAAISTTLTSFLSPGDHAVFQDAIYGGTQSLVLEEFDRLGIEYTFAACNSDALIAAVKPNTRIVYAESPANPLLQVVDLRRLVDGAKSKNVITIVDNTFASPINQNPLEFGIDVVIHSGTKYLGGHSDLSFGAVVGNQEFIDRIYRKAIHYGGNLNALSCYLIERSIKTLAIRVNQQNLNAQRVAEFLAGHGCVDQVFYPGLKSHPGHSIAAAQMTGFGGMLSFCLAENLSAKSFLESLELIAPAMSLGAVESTVTIPALTSHKPLPQELREELGISDQLVRMSVGIESAQDLIQDLERALSRAADQRSESKTFSGIHR